MLPAFKQVVEKLFVRGLCKVVFATETLALGINMPARTVVIEKLSKWNGETHADITPGEYTQLTGRAGRRGLDVEGHGVVLWQPGLNPRELAGLASTRTYPLRSSFRPSYNMAVNLVHQFGRERSRELLEQSFAQFQADKARGRAGPPAPQERRRAGRLRRGRDLPPRRLHGVRAAAPRRSPTWRSARRGSAAPTARDEAVESLRRLRPGDVIMVPAGKFAGFAVVDRPGHRRRRGAPALRRHRRAAGTPAGAARLPDARRGAGEAEGPQVVQRPQPADAARPGRRRCAPAPTT